jgi:DeoR/GlpR family transcriptional regulator of sugar metabolism
MCYIVLILTENNKMPLHPSPRQTQILEWLQTQTPLTIEELVLRLGVSLMTVHRDLDQLANMGLVRKYHGGVSLLEQEVVTANIEPLCRMCHIQISPRTAFTIHLVNGEQILACCPHCGLLMMVNLLDIASALAKDFLYGRSVNVFQAGFVFSSEVALCCEPSVLCFNALHEAEKFVQGFGGQAMTYRQAIAFLQAHHSGHEH